LVGQTTPPPDLTPIQPEILKNDGNLASILLSSHTGWGKSKRTALCVTL